MQSPVCGLSASLSAFPFQKTTALISLHLPLSPNCLSLSLSVLHSPSLFHLSTTRQNVINHIIIRQPWLGLYQNKNKKYKKKQKLTYCPSLCWTFCANILKLNKHFIPSYTSCIAYHNRDIEIAFLPRSGPGKFIEQSQHYFADYKAKISGLWRYVNLICRWRGGNLTMDWGVVLLVFILKLEEFLANGNRFLNKWFRTKN